MTMTDTDTAILLRSRSLNSLKTNARISANSKRPRTELRIRYRYHYAPLLDTIEFEYCTLQFLFNRVNQAKKRISRSCWLSAEIETKASTNISIP